MKKQTPPEYPSEWERPEKSPLPLNVLEGRGFNVARMISASKSGYRDSHPKNLVVFNANIVTIEGGKIWYGDLDLTEDARRLKDAADEAGQTLYVLYERDCRFGTETQTPKALAAKAVWNTTQGVPQLDKEFKVVFKPAKK
jgi:hypothetical protein